jgi:hypothetical protein
MSLVKPSAGHQKNQNGLALIEVLLSLGLSSVMFLVLFTAQSHSQKVIVYSQQLHYANRLLDQVAHQVWAYPNHYQVLFSTASPGSVTCLHGGYCNPVAMVQAWGAYWQAEMELNLPNGQLGMFCDSGCISGDTLYIRLTWLQSLAVATDLCQQGVACIDLKVTL